MKVESHLSLDVGGQLNFDGVLIDQVLEILFHVSVFDINVSIFFLKGVGHFADKS